MWTLRSGTHTPLARAVRTAPTECSPPLMDQEGGRQELLLPKHTQTHAWVPRESETAKGAWLPPSVLPPEAVGRRPARASQGPTGRLIPRPCSFHHGSVLSKKSLHYEDVTNRPPRTPVSSDHERPDRLNATTVLTDRPELLQAPRAASPIHLPRRQSPSSSGLVSFNEVTVSPQAQLCVPQHKYRRCQLGSGRRPFPK